MMEIKNYTKEIKEAMVQKQEVEKLQKELTFVLIGDIDSKRKLEEQITEKNNLLNGLRERIQTELETEKEKFKSEEELKKLENQLVKGQKIGIEALKKEIEESKNKFQEIMEELEKGDTSRAEELKQESEKLADKTKMLKKYEADMYKFAEYKSIEKNQQEYKEVSEMLSTIKTGKWLEEMNDMINPQKDDTQKDDSKKDDTRKDDTRKDDTKKKVPEMTEEDLENYRNNIYDWVANNTDGLTKEEKNNLRDEKSDDSDIKKKTDYEWHPELTEEQIDELWAEGIVPGSDEYRMKLGNFGINPENENSENEDEKVNLDINKKTGKCKITSNDLEFETKMDAADYTRRALRKFRKELLKNHNISDEDKVYIENIDPTIYKAYKEYDSKTEGKNQVVKKYIDSVIKKSKALEKDENVEVDMPGKVNVDIGWHPTQKNIRDKEQGFKKLKNIFASRRADRILKKHGMPGVFSWKRMNIANVSDNRRGIALLGVGASGVATLGTIAHLQSSNPEQIQNNNSQQIEQTQDENRQQSEVQGPKQIYGPTAPVIENSSDEKDDNDKRDDNDRNNNVDDKNKIYPGDVITAERFSALYGSADEKESNGALNTNETIGVNKIACTIDGKTYSTKDYSADEIYIMAEKANVDVEYHVDRAVNIDGKMCVQVMEKGNPSPIYIYNDNGTIKTSSGTKWNGDVESSDVAGWMKSQDVKKAKDIRISIKDSKAKSVEKDDAER